MSDSPKVRRLRKWSYRSKKVADRSWVPFILVMGALACVKHGAAASDVAWVALVTMSLLQVAYVVSSEITLRAICKEWSK